MVAKYGPSVRDRSSCTARHEGVFGDCGVQLSADDRTASGRWVGAPSLRADVAQRARIVLLAADGVGTNEIVSRVGVAKPTVPSGRSACRGGGWSGCMTGPNLAGR